MHDAPLPDLVLYERPGCHLCDDTHELVIAILDERRRAGLVVPSVVERDITTNPEWERSFLTTIPVLEIGDRRLELALSAGKIRRLLADALDVATDPTASTASIATTGTTAPTAPATDAIDAIDPLVPNART